MAMALPTSLGRLSCPPSVRSARSSSSPVGRRVCRSPLNERKADTDESTMNFTAKLHPEGLFTNVVEGGFSEVAGRGVYALCSGSEWEERSVQNFLDGLVRSTKTVMTRVELGGTLFLVAVIGVLLTSREEGGNSD